MTNFEQKVICMIGILLVAIFLRYVTLDVMFWFGIVVCFMGFVTLWLIEGGFELIKYYKDLLKR